MIRAPSCTGDPKACRISCLSTVSTCVAWLPVFDGNGDPVFGGGGDPNTITSHYLCATCGKAWSVAVRMGVETVSEYAA